MDTNETSETFVVTEAVQKIRLNLVMCEIGEFWREGRINHFTNHGSTHSELVHQRLAQLSQELFKNETRLRTDEVFILSAAAWLYEIGMQSPKLEPLLGPNITWPLGDDQKHIIWEHRYELSAEAILDSVNNHAAGPQIATGLPGLSNDYVTAIADVVRNCDRSIPLSSIEEQIPVSNVFVRLRLMVALLRLADQMYIDSTRVNLDLLSRSTRPIQERARWWVYDYAKTLPLERGNIRFSYSLPAKHSEYIEHIRLLVEPQFELESNPAMQYLRQQFDLRLSLDPNPHFQPDASNFRREMSDEMIMFLRQEVRIDPKRPTIAIDQRTSEYTHERGLMVLDYENLILQLGQLGHFPTQNEMRRLLVKLMEIAAAKHREAYDFWAIGHWERAELQDAEKMLSESTFFKLLHAGHGERSWDVLRQELDGHLTSSSKYKRVLFVTPPIMAAEMVRDADQMMSVYTWIADLPEADLFRILKNFELINDLLDLSTENRIAEDELLRLQTVCVLAIEDAAYDQPGQRLTANRVLEILSQLTDLPGSPQWWNLLLRYHGILHAPDPANANVVALQPAATLVLKASRRCDETVETLLSLNAAPKAEIAEDVALKEMMLGSFETAEEAQAFLEGLKTLNIVYRNLRQNVTTWSLNPNHRRVYMRDIARYKRLFMLGFDHALAENGFAILHKHTMRKNLAGFVNGYVLDPVQQNLLDEGVIVETETNETHRKSGQPIIATEMNAGHAAAASVLASRDIVLNTLRRAPNHTLERHALINSVVQIKVFAIDALELDQWLALMAEKNMLVITIEPENPKRDRITLNTKSLTVQRVLGRQHVFGLVKNMRIMRATEPRNSKPPSEIIERLRRYETHGDQAVAGWAIDYAKSARILGTQAGEAAAPETLFLKNNHGFVRSLDQRERGACQRIVELVTREVRISRHDDAPLAKILSEMQKEPETFGYSRAEHEYWINQSIYRHKLVKMVKKSPSTGRGRPFDVLELVKQG